MPIGVRPRVNEAREFLEIAKDFRDPKEIIREALSNSWDANATEVAFEFRLSQIVGTRARQIDVRIADNGDGMNEKSITDFFDLGESHKTKGSIGTKGHGTKIYYKSLGISLDTWSNGQHIQAETEVPPWPTLLDGSVPTYRWEVLGNHGRGTVIKVLGFQAKQVDFKDLQELIRYIKWYTVFGSFGGYFGDSRSIKLKIKSLDLTDPITIDFGFQFPPENTDLSSSTSQVCKLFPPERIDCGETSSGQRVELNVIGAILGESLRNIVADTYTHMGLWLSKDFIKVERVNDIIETVSRGQYFYRSFLFLANCQQLDLTANREAFHRGDEAFELVFESLEKYFLRIWSDAFTKQYFETGREEDEAKKQRHEADEHQRTKESRERTMAERIKAYENRITLNVNGVIKAPIKEPVNEAETILLLQAMISSRHARALPSNIFPNIEVGSLA